MKEELNEAAIWGKR